MYYGKYKVKNKKLNVISIVVFALSPSMWGVGLIIASVTDYWDAVWISTIVMIVGLVIGAIISGFALEYVRPRSAINNLADSVDKLVQAQSQQSSSLDEIPKLKKLLDEGLITQDEFELKRKQLLGL